MTRDPAPTVPIASKPATAPLSDASLAERRFAVLEVPVHAVEIAEVVGLISSWARDQKANRYVVLGGMHGVMESRRRPDVRRAYEGAALVVADGMPLVWLARRRGFRLGRRVYGPDLLTAVCQTQGAALRHFFYGGAPGVAEQLAATLRERHGITVAGTYCPPFRELTATERAEVLRLIATCRPDVVWVGIGAPRQELWMADVHKTLAAPVCVGVGAAFDFLTGRKPSAPRWAQDHGLEWAFRLATEPRRLWRRYLGLGPAFVALVAREEWRSRRPP